MATVCGYCLWLLFVATVCGCCLWLLFVATVCGYCLWLLFVATVCGLLFVATVCGYCLWLLFVATVCGHCLFVAPPPLSSPVSSPLSSPLSSPAVLTRSSAGRRRAPASILTRILATILTTILTRGSHHPRRSSAGRRRAPASILTRILTTILTRGSHPVVGWSSSFPCLYPHHYPHPRFSPGRRRLVVVAPPPLSSPVSSPLSSPLSSPAVLTTPGPHHPRFSPPAPSSWAPPRLYPHPRSSPPAVLTPGLKRSSEALEAAATVRAWGAAGLRAAEGIWGCSHCEGPGGLQRL